MNTAATKQQTAGAVKRRPWLRFGLRTLMLAMLLAAVAFAWIARHVQQARDREAIVAELDKMGVYVWQYESTPLGRRLRALPFPAEDWLRRVGGDSLLSGPSAISAYSIRDDQIPFLLERLSRFPTLQIVNFGGGQLSDAAVARIRQALPGVEVQVDPEISLLRLAP